MPTYQHILLAIFPDHRDNQLVYKALSLVEDCSARFSLLTVINSEHYQPTELLNQIKLAKQRLASLGRELVVPSFDQHIRLGQVPEMIIKTANELGVDSVICGLSKSTNPVNFGLANSLMTTLSKDLILMHY